jgi:hypothetical protein
MSNLLAELISLRSLLSSREAWTQHIMAKSKDGLPVLPTDPRAKCWCLVGGCEKVSSQPGQLIQQLCSIRSSRNFKLDSIEARLTVASFNDEYDTTHEDILILIDAAIMELKESDGSL